MSKHVFRGLAALLLAVLATVLVVVPASAAEVRSGGDVTIASGEVIDNDLYLAGNHITVDGTINGELWAAGRTITINGTVNGSLVAIGQTVNINGEVAQTVRAASATVNVSGGIGGDLLAFSGEVIVASVAEIGGDLLLGVGNARIDGPVNGYIHGGGSDVTLADGVGGEVEIRVDSLTVTSGANIQGNLTYTSENEADIQPGAQIGGKTTHKLPKLEDKARFGIFSGVWGKVLGFLMILLVGVIIVLLAPRRTALFADSLRKRPWLSLGWGALILVVTPIAVIVACITIIGIPLGLIALVLYAIAIYLSQIPVALLIGRWIIGRFRGVETRAIMVAALALGLAILSLLKSIPYFGFVVGLATVLFGLGTLVVSWRR
jgi:cytoskeletal protein CcmA (bactofilin family)